MLTDNETTDAYKKMEIPRLIEEALIYDDRISGMAIHLSNLMLMDTLLH